MPKIASFKSVYVPKDIEFLDENGKRKKNADFPAEEQVKAELSYATIDQKNRYMQFYSETGKGRNDAVKMFQNYDYNSALKKHVKRIFNLFDENGKEIANGDQLVSNENYNLNDLKQDLFFRICGIRVDDEPDDGPGELTQGEKIASG